VFGGSIRVLCGWMQTGMLGVVRPGFFVFISQLLFLSYSYQNQKLMTGISEECDVKEIYI